MSLRTTKAIIAAIKPGTNLMIDTVTPNFKISLRPNQFNQPPIPPGRRPCPYTLRRMLVFLLSAFRIPTSDFPPPSAFCPMLLSFLSEFRILTSDFHLPSAFCPMLLSLLSAFRIPTSDFPPPSDHSLPVYLRKVPNQLSVVKFPHHALFARRNDPVS